LLTTDLLPHQKFDKVGQKKKVRSTKKGVKIAESSGNTKILCANEIEITRDKIG